MTQYSTLLTLIIMMTSSMINGQAYNPSNYDDHVTFMKSADLEGMTMSYIDEGQGPVVVLVHGIPTTSWLYRKMVPGLVKKGYRVIVPDMMGAGESLPVNNKGILNFSGQSHCLSLLLDQLKISDCTLVVHDAGGPWSYKLLRQEGHPVSRMVLLNTILYTEGFHPPVRPKEGSMQHRMISWAYGKKWIANMIISSTLKQGVERQKLSREALEGYKKGMSKKGKAQAGQFFGSLRSLDEEVTMARTAMMSQNIPLLAIWGQKDKILRGQEQLPLAMRDLNLPSANVHILAGCGHFIQEEAPEDIVHLIHQFISEK